MASHSESTAHISFLPAKMMTYLDKKQFFFEGRVVENQILYLYLVSSCWAICSHKRLLKRKRIFNV